MTIKGTYDGTVHLNRVREVIVVPIRACLEFKCLARGDVQIGDVGTRVSRVRCQHARIEVEHGEGVIGVRREGLTKPASAPSITKNMSQ